jgi:hypothetical protein
VLLYYRGKKGSLHFVRADQDVEKEVMAQYSSVKQAKAADLRAFRESLLKK